MATFRKIMLTVMAFVLVVIIPTVNFNTDIRLDKSYREQQIVTDLTKDGPNYTIEIGGDHGLIHVRVNHDPAWITAVGNGIGTAANWVANTATNGFNTVKGWFVHD